MQEGYQPSHKAGDDVSGGDDVENKADEVAEDVEKSELTTGGSRGEWAYKNGIARHKDNVLSKHHQVFVRKDESQRAEKIIKNTQYHAK